MKNNKVLYIIIVLLILVIACGAIYFLNKSVPKIETNNQPNLYDQEQTSPATEELSEEPDKAKAAEYISEIHLGKMPEGKEVGKDGFPTKANIFIEGEDQLCTEMTLKKTIPAGSLSVAVYDKGAGNDYMLKTIFPMELKFGGTSGCSTLDQPPGRYEYKLYIDDILVSVLPFEVK